MQQATNSTQTNGTDLESEPPPTTDNFHWPERLENETQASYHMRRRMSKRLQQRNTLGHASGGGRDKNRQQLPFALVKASKAKLARRALVKAVGIRQARRHMREARASYKAGLTMQAAEAQRMSQ